MKLKGYIFDTANNAIEIRDDFTSEQYEHIWDALQAISVPHDNIQGFLVLQKEDK